MSFRLREFQAADLAAIACTDGALLAWEQGLGKGIAQFILPLLKCGWTPTLRGIQPKSASLLINPAGLIAKSLDDAARHFRTHVTRITRAHLDQIRDGTPLPPGYYITAYTDLPLPYTDQLTWGQVLSTSFTCVVVDEGTRLKDDTTELASQVLQLRPQYRFILSGTPIKNRLGDFFWLLWWTAGGHPHPCARFPYGPKDQERFMADHLVTERPVLSNGQGSATAQVCNLFRIWKILSPLVLRRRKSDTGEPIVARRDEVSTIPMGTRQQAAYDAILRETSQHTVGTKRKNIISQLNALRQAATLGPDCDLLTPKLFAILQVLQQLHQRGEQSVIFSSFREPLKVMARRLKQARVNYAIVDGASSADKRGEICAEFAAGGTIQHLLMTYDSGSEGYSFSRCSHLLLMDRHWALDKCLQAPARIHRLNSERPITVYEFMSDGTIEKRIYDLGQEKSDSSDLVLDGRLESPVVKEVSAREVLEWAATQRHADTIDEETIEAQWPTLQNRFLQPPS